MYIIICLDESYIAFAGIVNQEESLFTYQLRENWNTFYDPMFTPLFMPVFANESLEAEAREACNNDTFCLYDIATTGRMDIGLSTLEGSRGFDEIVQLSYPSMYVRCMSGNLHYTHCYACTYVV